MGNCCSSEDTSGLHELVTHSRVEQPMSAQTIQRGLYSVAASLNAKGQNISIVAVGGAVNTLLLHTRESTADVDFFYRTKTRNADVTRLIGAAKAAATKLNLGDQWLSYRTSGSIEVRFELSFDISPT